MKLLQKFVNFENFNAKFVGFIANLTQIKSIFCFFAVLMILDKNPL